MNPERIKKLASHAGTLLATGGVLFVVYTLVHAWQQIPEYLDLTLMLAWLPGLAMAYGASQLLISWGWHRLLQQHHGRPLPFRQIHAINARTQIAKYLPTNLMHLAGRIGLGRQAGIDAGALVRASMDEVLLMVFFALLVAGIGLALLHTTLSGLLGPYVPAAIVTLALLVLLRLVFRKKTPAGDAPANAGRLLLSTLWCGLPYLGFIVVATVINTALAHQVAPFADWQAARAFFVIYLCAWLIGFLTPGAPGGIGVREALLLVALGQAGTNTAALAVALATRLLSMLGDLVFFATSFPGQPLQGLDKS